MDDKNQFPLKGPRKTLIFCENELLGYVQEDGARYFDSAILHRACKDRKPLLYVDEDGHETVMHPEDFEAVLIEKYIFSFSGRLMGRHREEVPTTD